MGDRAIIHFQCKANGENNEISPAVYLHWAGNRVRSLLQKTMELMKDRPKDQFYSCARFIGVCHENIEGNVSLGTWNGPKLDTIKETRAAILEDIDYSRGDAGVFLVDVSKEKWTVETVGGYGFRGYNSNIPTSKLVKRYV